MGLFNKKEVKEGAIINSDEEDTISWELFSGMGLLIATYLYDRYIQLNK